MTVKRVKTSRKKGALDIVALVETAEGKFEINNTQATLLDTTTKLQAELGKQLSTSSLIFFHKNRDGSIAIATGQEPNIWPEDE